MREGIEEGVVSGDQGCPPGTVGEADLKFLGALGDVNGTENLGVAFVGGQYRSYASRKVM
ncbi:hypothetical protein MOV08_12990 [Streptomyces yunnanensis]|uniref:Uncharacterized protein n=1 Tax=Streptomyces yunnanensis TaxID=156453 RepID=A0ABY8A573_9ACTN|nr:hypothetical protein [Streptomyces yunnanensis]WEB40103.1 hypothetical protein MOV08_12990 [Streptomyces yunnanensis]